MGMDSALDFHSAKALLDWQFELGATEAIGDAPVNRYELPDKLAIPAAVRKPQPIKPGVAPVVEQQEDPVRVARQAADNAGSLEGLAQAMAGYELCELRKGARNLVFSDGIAGAPVMIIGEAPGRDEDREGRPFVGRAGHLLDRMLAAIGLDRTENVYITNVLPWRPPQNRDPKPDEIAMMKPFLERHVALAKPKAIVLMGDISCQAVLDKRGISRLRGQWAQAMDLPIMPMFHPAYLLRQPRAKRAAWADLLELNARLKDL